ncbi:MAG: hypothetical protein AAF203_04590, partial [Pseudomonadota bacterium]
IYNFVIDFKNVKTDPNHAKIQHTRVILDDKKYPEYSIAFRKALFGLTGQVRERYKNEFGISDAEMLEWGNYDIRGMEHFRDTHLGEKFTDTYSWLPADFKARAAAVDFCSSKERSDFELGYMSLVEKRGANCEPKAGTHGYIAKTLAGIWATAPYLHNASVPTIHGLVSPPKRRRKGSVLYDKDDRPGTFYTGCRVYDHERLGYVSSSREYKTFGCALNTERNQFKARHSLNAKISINGENLGNYQSYDRRKFDADGRYTGGYTNGNYNGGHDGPGQIIEDDKARAALMTFLKVLHPPREYSWDSPKSYEIIAPADFKGSTVYAGTNQIKCNIKR